MGNLMQVALTGAPWRLLLLRHMFGSYNLSPSKLFQTPMSCSMTGPPLDIYKCITSVGGLGMFILSLPDVVFFKQCDAFF